MGHPNPYINEILTFEQLKTWSLIVTIFGDLDSDVLTGAQLRKVLEPLGIKPEATRVALHRLKAEGWIAAQRSGREAHYRLSAQGRSETEAVRAEVYGHAHKHPDGWRLILSGQPFENDAGIQLSRDAWLVPACSADLPLDVWGIDPNNTAIPAWVETILVPPELGDTAMMLTGVLAKSRARLDDMSPADLLALRLLTLHHWRRLALRRGTWAHLSLFKDGSIKRCRDAVIEMLDQSARTSL